MNYELELNFKEQTLKFNEEEQEETYLFLQQHNSDWANIFKEMIYKEEIKSLRDWSHQCIAKT